MKKAFLGIKELIDETKIYKKNQFLDLYYYVKRNLLWIFKNKIE